MRLRKDHNKKQAPNTRETDYDRRPVEQVDRLKAWDAEIVRFDEEYLSVITIKDLEFFVRARVVNVDKVLTKIRKEFDEWTKQGREALEAACEKYFPGKEPREVIFQLQEMIGEIPRAFYDEKADFTTSKIFLDHARELGLCQDSLARAKKALVAARRAEFSFPSDEVKWL